MFSANDIINLKEVVYNQGSWDKHTRISIDGSNRNIENESTIKTYAMLLSSAISLQAPGEFHFAERETGKSFSIFQLVEKSCITGNFSSEKSSSDVEIFSPKNLDLDKILRITSEFFNCKGLEVITYNKVS